MADHLDSKSLVPFKRRRNGYHLPGMAKEKDEQMVDQVDPDLRPEEQGYVRHYLAYADAMLAAYKEPNETSSPQQNVAPAQNKVDAPETQKDEQKSDPKETVAPEAASTPSTLENSNPETPADDRAA